MIENEVDFLEKILNFETISSIKLTVGLGIFGRKLLGEI